MIFASFSQLWRETQSLLTANDDEFQSSLSPSEEPTTESDPTPTSAHIELKSWVDRLIEAAKKVIKWVKLQGDTSR